MPKVSVIIPNYNHARFLEKRIKSVLNQTYRSIEVIFLDDASTDNSKELFERYARDCGVIRGVFNKVNSGSVFKQWNKGVRESKGEYVWIAESDDYADEHFLEKLVDILDKNPGIGLAYSHSWQIDENDNVRSKLKSWLFELEPERWKKGFMNSGKDECARYLMFGNTIPNASAVLIRRSVYQKVGGAPEEMKLNGDWMLWSKILLVSDIAFIADPLNYFRSHANTVRNIAIRSGLNIEEWVKVIRYISQHAKIPEDTLKKVLDCLVIHWANSTFICGIPLTRHLNIYKIACTTNRQLTNRILIKKMPRILVKRILKKLFR